MKISELKGQTAHLAGLNNINVIMGRNGAGKSRFLRDLEAVMSQNGPLFYVRYVSPERAGTFKRDGNVLTNMSDKHTATWYRLPVRDSDKVPCKRCGGVLFSGKSVREYDQVSLL